MRTIAHVSDVHFGREDPVLVEAVLADLAAVRPDVVALSGDLTQRARRAQFRAARAWLDRIEAPLVVVPGNHDIPLFDVLRRFLRPLNRYRRHITADLLPLWLDDEIAVLGVNTARSNVWKSGRIGEDQIEWIRRTVTGLPAGRFCVLMAHHPFTPPPGQPTSRLVGRGREALEAAADAGVQLALAGHNHVAYTGDVRAHYSTLQRAIVCSQAGTATSHRRRGVPNGWTQIVVDLPVLRLVDRVWDGERFVVGEEVAYRCVDGVWEREGGAAAPAGHVETPPPT